SDCPTEGCALNSACRVPPRAALTKADKAVYSPSRVLLIDDDDRLRERLASALTERGLRVDTAPGTGEALALLAQQQFDAIVTDLRMPKVTGLQFVEELVRVAPDARVIVLTGYGTIAT